jgi:hypothetical protein
MKILKFKFKHTDIIGILCALVIIISVFNYVHAIYKSIKYGSDNYYVNLFPENADSKNYRVVGKVEYVDDEYNLIKATFPNGGYVTFDDYYSISPLEFYEKVHIEDDDGKSWYVELTKEKVIDK